VDGSSFGLEGRVGVWRERRLEERAVGLAVNSRRARHGFEI
jgi:hypothetical protein